MARSVSIRHKRKEAPEWVFPWRPRGESYFPKLLALAFVTVVFTLFITSVKIQVTVPTPWAARKAAVILAANDADGRALTLRAREGGPFPSRFEPAEWGALKDLEKSAFADSRWTPPAYEPALRPLPEKSLELPLLVDQDGPVLPKRKTPPAEAPPAQNHRLAPVIAPLSGIDRAAIPSQLPAFEGVIDADLTSETWRFLVRLGPAGNVEQCAALTGGDEKPQMLLAEWLRRVVFKEDAKPARWISVAVSFSNQSLSPADGTLDR
jgi:hypothetical protein